MTTSGWLHARWPVWSRWWAAAASGALLGLLVSCGASGNDSTVDSQSGDAAAVDSGTSIDRTLRDERIVESSGLAVSNVHDGVLYTHNDSDDGPYVYAVGTDGETLARLELIGAPARDWEAIATQRTSSGGRVYVGDIGDNRSTWPSVRVHVFDEPARLSDRRVEATQYDFVYPDGPRDAEALMVSPTTGRVYVVSKRITGAAIYLAPEELSTTSVNQWQRWRSAPAVVTDGAFSPDGNRYALRSYFRVYVYDSRTGEELQSLNLPLQPQGESLAWTPDGEALLIGSEGSSSDVLRIPTP